MLGEIFIEIQLAYTSSLVLNCPWCAHLFKSMLDYYFQGLSFVWLAFVTTLKPEEVLSIGSFIFCLWVMKASRFVSQLHQGHPPGFSAESSSSIFCTWLLLELKCNS